MMCSSVASAALNSGRVTLGEVVKVTIRRSMLNSSGSQLS